MDVAVLRAEIKAWERDFRSSHGRDPSIQEIKDQPHIATKYKLYKSLSKPGPSRAFSQHPPSPPPSAPPHPPPSSILPKSRAVKVDPPTATSNPFSPVKNRKKFQHPASSSQRASNQSPSDPFATPSKPKNNPPAPRRSSSPDPFPPIEPLLLAQHLPLSSAVDSPVTRARKRLRGEQVSPSPVKEKRARVASQAALSFTGHAAPRRSPDDSDGDDHPADLNDTIIGETPMKPRIGRKNFQVLFDDTLTNGDKRPTNPLPSSQMKATSSAPNSGLKREKSRALTPPSDEEDDWNAKPKLRSLEASVLMHPRPVRLGTRIVNGKRGVPGSLVPTKDDLHSAISPPTASQSNVSGGLHSRDPSKPLQATNKRTFPDDLDDTSNINAAVSNILLNLPLIPPSPPPDALKSTGPKYTEKGKGKSGPYSRKKVKLLPSAEDASEEEPGGVEDDEIQVREIDPLARLPQVDLVDDVGPGWDTQWRTQDNTNDPTVLSSVDPGRFEVNLPDELQRVLAISPGSRRREVEEEKVVRGLLYGSRETHYDAGKGGEIWDVGEESEHGEGTEDDWEGEPVPWEVGEL